MTEAYAQYAVQYDPATGQMAPAADEGDLKSYGTDKKARFAASVPNSQVHGIGNYSAFPTGGHQQVHPNGLNNNVAAMAAVLGQMSVGHHQSPNPSNPYSHMMGINTGIAGPGPFLSQTSPFLGSPNLAQFSSPNLGVNTGGLSATTAQSFASPLLGNGFQTPNSGNLAAFPSPALSQGSFGGVPTGQTSAFSTNSMPMQQMMGMGFNGSQSPGGGQSGRTVYVGSLPADAAVDELLSQVRFGPIDNVKILPEKNCAFISFLDATTAAAFHSDALMRKIQLHGQELKIGWGKPSAVPANVVMAVQQNGATRNVYLGNLEDTMTEQTLRDEVSRFGPIDQVKIVRDKNIGFVHFLSIATAIKVVQNLSADPEWAGRRVNYGKDRCAYVPKNQHQQQQHNMAAAAMAATAAGYVGFSNSLGGMGVGDATQIQPGNRTVYLGNIHPETSLEEICNTIRGGILQQIRYIQDKHIAFVTFVDSNAALAFYHMATVQGIALHNRRLKVGWGKHSGPPSPGIAMVVQAGGSRNVYIGQIEDFDLYDEPRIRQDFSQYGEIELVNLLKEKNCAFVNFTNIANSIKAIEGMKSHEEYSKFKIAYGKDRCANPPRQAPWSSLFGNNGSRSAPANMQGFPAGQLSPGFGMDGVPSPNAYSVGAYSPNPASNGGGNDEFVEIPSPIAHSNYNGSHGAVTPEIKQDLKE